MNARLDQVLLRGGGGFVALAVALLVVACAPAAPPAPTTAPPRPTAAAAPPAVAPTAAPAPTTAPTTGPAAKAVDKPPEQPAAKSSPSFAGKTIRLIVGASAGGGFDLWGRTIARHLGKYLPGRPTAIVENQPAGSGRVAASLLYNKEPKDGTAIGQFSSTHVLSQLVGEAGIEFDMGKFNWIGRVEANTPTCMVRRDLGIKSFKELVDSKREVILGATAPGGGMYNFPAVVKYATGVNFKIVPGYQGQSPTANAIERGEVDGFCVQWEPAKAALPQWFETSPHYVVTLVQQGPKRHTDIPDVPLAEEFATSEQNKRLILVSNAPNAPMVTYVSYAAPPGVPAPELAALRQGFAAVFKDPEFLADSARAKLEPSYQGPEEITKVLNDVLSSPPEIVQLLKKVIFP